MRAAISFDWETRSVLNLKKVGHWKYAAHSSTGVLCASWAIDMEDPEIWFPGQPIPSTLLEALEEGGDIHAWNAAFEYAIWTYHAERHGLPLLPLERFHCTMARALHWGMPPSLDQASKVAGLTKGKDMEGHRLMLQVSKPRKTKDGTIRWWTDDDPVKLLRLGAYCCDDVAAERGIARTLPVMPAFERKVWLLDQRMNERGLAVDVPLLDRLQTLTDEATKGIGAEFSAITGGVVTKTTQGQRLVKFLQASGAPVTSLNKNVLPEVLENPELTGTQRELLELWKKGAKTSTAKLKAISNTLDADHRIRGLVQYGGAFRTLRWAGRGPQVQNFPRPIKGLDCSWAVHDMLAGAGLDALSVAYGNPLDVISSCLRSVFIPQKGYVLVVVDYSGIEARVVAWLADHKDLLKVFKSGEDVYVYTAGQLGSDNRQFGKVLVLACGYGMGVDKFIDTAATYGLHLSWPEGKEAVYGWRDANRPIKDMWYAYEQAAFDTIYHHDYSSTQCGKVAFRMAKHDGKLAGSLLMELPSGRPIVYRDAHIAKVKVKKFLRNEDTGEPLLDERGKPKYVVEEQERIAYSGLNLAKKWVKITTWGGKLVENATQAIARELLADALIRLDDRNVPLDTTIHDEIIAEPLQRDAAETFTIMKDVMTNPPPWARGLPLGAEGKPMMRYGKG